MIITYATWQKVIHKLQDDQSCEDRPTIISWATPTSLCKNSQEKKAKSRLYTSWKIMVVHALAIPDFLSLIKSIWKLVKIHF